MRTFRPSVFPRRVGIVLARAPRDEAASQSAGVFEGGKCTELDDAAKLELVLYDGLTAREARRHCGSAETLFCAAQDFFELVAPEHCDVVAAQLQAWRRSSAISAKTPLADASPNAERLLQFLAQRYDEALASIAPDPMLLQMAYDVLPAERHSERRVLRAAVARAAAAGLVPRTPRLHVDDDRTQAGPLAQPGWRDQSPHQLLELCFAHLEQRYTSSAQTPRDFEHRSGQREMATAVLENLLSGSKLIVEAGTGTGKTLAYALPAILFAALTGKRVLLSTRTRNLQAQLVDGELPTLWRALGLHDLPRGDGERGLRFGKLLGRNNYVCLSALKRQVQQAVQADGSLALARVILAVLRSADGVLADVLPDVEPALWRDICSRRETCLGRTCRGPTPCPVHVARERARGLDVVVVNHALLLADARGENAILGEWNALILDEAHNLDRVATEAFGLRLGRLQVEAFARPLARLESEGRALQSIPELGRWMRRLAEWSSEAREVQSHLLAWLQNVDEALPSEHRVPARQRFRDGDEVFGRVRHDYEELILELQRLTSRAASLLDTARDEAEDNPFMREATEVFEVCAQLYLEALTALEFFVNAADDDWAFYLDFAGDNSSLHEIVALPLDVAEPLQESFGGRRLGVVYTSATLCVGGDFSYFRSRMGLDAQTERLRLDSPFDYAEQCLVVGTATLGTYRDPDFHVGVAEIVERLSRSAQKRILTLLTSHASLQRLARLLTDMFGADAPLFAQGISGSRSRIASRFAATPGAILLGTDSFWEGVDFPGQALEVLVITKLPFLVPDEPWVAARSERLRRAGDDPFTDFVLPEAVLRFRQGFGRLIRSHKDRGVVVLLDGRLETRPYGAAFLEALPTGVQAFDDSTALVDAARDWLSQKGCHA